MSSQFHFLHLFQQQQTRRQLQYEVACIVMSKQEVEPTSVSLQRTKQNKDNGHNVIIKLRILLLS